MPRANASAQQPAVIAARARLAAAVVVFCGVCDAHLPSCIAWITAVCALRFSVVIQLGVTLVVLVCAWCGARPRTAAAGGLVRRAGLR